jgi:hypothetical protein
MFWPSWPSSVHLACGSCKVTAIAVGSYCAAVHMFRCCFVRLQPSSAEENNEVFSPDKFNTRNKHVPI